MRTAWLLWVYRKILAATLLTCYVLAAVLLLTLLAVWPSVVLYLLDLVSPITEIVRDALWGLFPDVEWIRKAGKWMGAGVRWSFSFAQARSEAIGRLMLLDGLLLLTLMAWGLNRLLGFWVTLRVSRWFNKRYVILKRADFERLRARKKAFPPESERTQEQELVVEHVVDSTPHEDLVKINRATNEVLLAQGKLPKVPELNIPHEKS